jgi:tetratricopeptide (TPR) repeat protein
MNWLEYLGWNQDQLEDLRYAGYLYIRQGKYDVALSFFETLVILSHNDAYDTRTLGALYLQKGNNIKALDLFDLSLQKDPNHLPTLLNKTKALFSLGYYKQAVEQAKKLKFAQDPLIQSKAEALILTHQNLIK